MPNPFQILPVPSSAGKSVSMGILDHGGPAVATEFQLPISAESPNCFSLDGQAWLIVGEAGSGKTTFVKNIIGRVAGLPNARNRTPFLVIDGSTQGFANQLGHLEWDPPKVFSANSNSSPLPFNPFAVPQGACKNNFVHWLCRCFHSIGLMDSDDVDFWSSRLRGLYQQNSNPSVQDLKSCFSDANLDDQSSRNGSKSKIIEMLKVLGQIFDTHIDNQRTWEPLFSSSFVFECGRIAESRLRTLVAALISTNVLARLESKHVNQEHILVVEDAHRFSFQGTSSIVQTVAIEMSRMRTPGQCIMVTDRKPCSEHISDNDFELRVALQKTSDKLLVDELAERLNLNPDQLQYARLGLKNGETIIFDQRNGIPVLLQSGNLFI